MFRIFGNFKELFGIPVSNSLAFYKHNRDKPIIQESPGYRMNLPVSRTDHHFYFDQ